MRFPFSFRPAVSSTSPAAAAPCLDTHAYRHSVLLLLIGLTTVVHYEVLSGLNARLPDLGIPARTKLLVVIFAAFVAHAMEIALYGLALYALDWAGVGSLGGPGGSSIGNCLYFSAET